MTIFEHQCKAVLEQALEGTLPHYLQHNHPKIEVIKWLVDKGYLEES